jgi:hypothetical protein
MSAPLCDGCGHPHVSDESCGAYEKRTTGDTFVTFDVPRTPTGRHSDVIFSYVPPEPSALEVQVGGDHYKRMTIQPIEYIQANDLGFCEGNAIKYVTRWRHKGGVQDLKKAIHYLEMLIEFEERVPV